MKKPTRVLMLKQASKLTSQDRNETYGKPSTNLGDIAALWTAYLRRKYSNKMPCEVVITAEDVAWLNVLQKMARTFSGKLQLDSYIDAAAYSAIAGECAQEYHNDKR